MRDRHVLRDNDDKGSGKAETSPDVTLGVSSRDTESTAKKVSR